MASCAYWTRQFNAQTGEYTCPWCDRTLKPKLSNSAKNPGKTFVTCNRDFGGCGLFSFLDAQPNDQYKPKTKRARDESDGTQGTNIMGPVANQPTVTDQRLAELAAKIDDLSTKIVFVWDYVKQVTEN